MKSRSPAIPVLVTGWFSFDTAEVTAGDLLALETVCRWLRRANIRHRVAMTELFRQSGQVSWTEVDPASVRHLLFVCGPAFGLAVETLFRRFARAQKVLVGVSVIDSQNGLGADVMIERDSEQVCVPDLSLGAPKTSLPVVGVVFSHPQPEYGDRQRHDAAHHLLIQTIRRMSVAPVMIDTRLDPRDGLRSAAPGQLESVLAKMDAVVTTRLHGLVLALRNGVPAVAVDPVAGGGKVTRQADALQWPAAVRLEDTSEADIRGMLTWCLSEEARDLASGAADRGAAGLVRTRRRLLEVLEGSTSVHRESGHRGRPTDQR